MAKNTTRDTILSEARALFMSRGFANTSIREICERSAISPPVLYYHFGSKEGLFQAVVEDTLSLDQFNSSLRQEVAARDDPCGKLGAFVLAYLTHYPTDMLNPGLHLGNSTQLDKVALGQIRLGIEAIWQLAREIVLSGIAAGEFREVDVDTVAACLTGTIDSFVRARVYLGVEYDLEEVAECVVDLYRHGLVAADAGSPL